MKIAKLVVLFLVGTFTLFVANPTPARPASGLTAGQGHGYTGMECREQFVSAFIDTGTTKDLDTNCLRHVPLPLFNVSKLISWVKRSM